jgi:hypothetical protein
LTAPSNLRRDKFLIAIGIQQYRQFGGIGGFNFENSGLIGVPIDSFLRRIEVNVNRRDFFGNWRRNLRGRLHRFHYAALLTPLELAPDARALDKSQVAEQILSMVRNANNGRTVTVDPIPLMSLGISRIARNLRALLRR